MRELYDTLRAAARTRVSTLLLGETGTGKEVLAQALHCFGAAPDAPYQAVNCAAIPATLLESVLFGHERGAFSGAERRRAGVFERAHGGTLLLDEVGELSLAAQASLLRVLETRRVVRVGGETEVAVDVRIVSATNRSLNDMVRDGGFRLDLLYRLNTLTVRVPPLRERLEEVEPLARLFQREATRQWKLPERQLDRDLGVWLRAQPWPGNVRQLKNVVERALVHAAPSSSVLTVADFVKVAEPIGLPAMSDPVVLEDAPAHGASFDERVRAFEAKLITEALRTTAGNQTRAAELLRIPRRTLCDKINNYRLGAEARGV
jgi:DNA-binding NtrC family response regulator